MGILGSNHPLLLSSYRYEVIKPNEGRTNRLKKLSINNKHPWLIHPLLGTNFREEFANSMNPVTMQKRVSSAPGGPPKRIKLPNSNPLNRTSARYDFMTQKPAGPGCPGRLPVIPNHINMHTAYRYETRMPDREGAPRQEGEHRANINSSIMGTNYRYEARVKDTHGALPPEGDFRARMEDPLMGTNFRYEYARPRPPCPEAAPV